MAEYTNANVASVAAGQNVPFTETAVSGNPCIVHREGAGIVTLRGLTNQCRARFKVSFGGNIAIPTGGAVTAISAAHIDVPRGCCLTVAVENTSDQTINIANANLIVERVA